MFVKSGVDLHQTNAKTIISSFYTTETYGFSIFLKIVLEIIIN